MSDSLKRLAMCYELRSMAARTRLQRVVQSQRREDALLCDSVYGWLAWLDGLDPDAGLEQRRSWLEQSEIGLTQIAALREQHEAERKALAAEWVALDETTRLLNRVASRPARRNIETGGEE